MEKGINPNIKDIDGDPVLLMMSDVGNNEMIELYLSRGGNLNAINEETKWNALHEAAFNGHLETTKYLISVGIDYKAKNLWGKTPLDLAKREENETEIVEFLLEVEKK